MTDQTVSAIQENRDGIAGIARQLEAIKAGRGFANLSFLRKHGLIASRREFLHTSTYSILTGKTEFMLTAKGREMLTAANLILMQVGKPQPATA